MKKDDFFSLNGFSFFGIFNLSMFLSLFLLLVSMPSSLAETGCFLYPESPHYCLDMDPLEAQQECSDYLSCDLDKHFFINESCKNYFEFSECRKIICDFSCEQKFQGQCATTNLSQDLIDEVCFDKVNSQLEMNSEPNNTSTNDLPSFSSSSAQSSLSPSSSSFSSADNASNFNFFFILIFIVIFVFFIMGIIFLINLNNNYKKNNSLSLLSEPQRQKFKLNLFNPFIKNKKIKQLSLQRQKEHERKKGEFLLSENDFLPPKLKRSDFRTLQKLSAQNLFQHNYVALPQKERNYLLDLEKVIHNNSKKRLSLAEVKRNQELKNRLNKVKKEEWDRIIAKLRKISASK